MNFNQTKRIEHDINAMQAKLGLLRAELKRCQDSVHYEELKEEIGSLEYTIDQMQVKYTRGKEANR